MFLSGELQQRAANGRCDTHATTGGGSCCLVFGSGRSWRVWDTGKQSRCAQGVGGEPAPFFSGAAAAWNSATAAEKFWIIAGGACLTSSPEKTYACESETPATKSPEGRNVRLHTHPGNDMTCLHCPVRSHSRTVLSSDPAPSGSTFIHRHACVLGAGSQDASSREPTNSCRCAASHRIVSTVIQTWAVPRHESSTS